MLSLDDTEKLLLAVPKLSVAIARLTTLKSIHLRDLAGPQGSRMLSKVCSRLTSACVSFDRNIHRLSNITRNHYDPWSLLEHSKDTLKSLEIDNTLLLRIVKPRFKRVYPDLTSLTLSGIWIPCAAGLYRTFPNLRKMEIRDGEPAVANSEYERWRASQRKSQEDYGSWQVLESFFGRLVDLYLLCPGCRIEYVHIDSEQDTVDAAMLRNVLAEARPTRLKLGTWPDSFLDEDWLGALSEQRHPKLQVLDMLMMVLYDSDEIIGYALDDLYDAIPPLSLQGFRLSIDIHGEETDRQLDIDAFAHRMMSATTESMKALCIALRVDDRNVVGRTVELGLESDLMKLDLHGSGSSVFEKNP